MLGVSLAQSHGTIALQWPSAGEPCCSAFDIIASGISVPQGKNFALDPLPLTLFHLFYLSLPAKVKVGLSPRMNVTKHLVQTSDYIPSSELITTCHSFPSHLWHFPLSDLLG